jgi:hypothetical protein
MIAVVVHMFAPVYVTCGLLTYKALGSIFCGSGNVRPINVDFPVPNAPTSEQAELGADPARGMPLLP